MPNFSIEHTDEDLVELYRKESHADAFEELCKRYTVPLYRFSVSFMRTGDDAEDVVQKTFIKMWKNLHTFDSSKKFSVWIYTIARRTALDEIKKRKTLSFSSLSREDELPFEETVEDVQAFTEESLANLRDVNAFEEILKTLPPEKAEIIFLKLYEDMTFEEIGEMTGRPMNTVKSVYRRSMEMVRNVLEEKYHVSAPK